MWRLEQVGYASTPSLSNLIAFNCTVVSTKCQETSGPRDIVIGIAYLWRKISRWLVGVGLETSGLRGDRR